MRCLEVEEVGANVRTIKPGLCEATVRRPGGSIYDQSGTYDMTLMRKPAMNVVLICVTVF